MKCLCCGKEMLDQSSQQDVAWHKKCIKMFFGTRSLPKIDLTEAQLEVLADNTVNKGLTVPGVQKKLSLHLSKDIDSRLTVVNYPTGYILKPQTDLYDSLPEFEDVAMRMAEITGIKVVPHALMKINDKYAYITKRIDRNINKECVVLYAMEDFCQLSNRLTQDKYKGSYEACARIIKKYSAYPGFDLTELFLRIVFSFVIGNSDMHLKNFSLMECESASRKFSLSAAYDMLPVNIVVPEDEEEMALTLNGKKRNLRKKDFLQFAEQCGISKKTALNMINKICSCKEKFLILCEESYLSEEQKSKLKALIEDRIKRIED